MKIVLGSENSSKKQSVILALNELEIFDYEILCINANSMVSSKPINDETLLGASNRNRNLMGYCKDNSIDYDLLISIEGGYEQVDNKYFIVTYASVFNKDGKEFVGKSQGLEITEKMFKWVNNGKSLNEVIEALEGYENNKKKDGISGYLSDSFYKRDKFDSTAVISAIVAMNYEKNYKKLNLKLDIK